MLFKRSPFPVTISKRVVLSVLIAVMRAPHSSSPTLSSSTSPPRPRSAAQSPNISTDPSNDLLHLPCVLRVTVPIQEGGFEEEVSG
ncbi:hypothetical protein PM082_021672 [Marasmius tenuissimus]|nr:hypothetical protein PM082_021672 [Marasmius tenuissimus]